MEELNLKDLLNYYLKKIPIIVAITLLFLILGYVYIEKIQIPMYHGTTTIILVEKQDEDVSSDVTSNELLINEKLVATYSQIVKSRRVLDQVIDELNLKDTVNELAERIEVTSVSETSIIKITVSDRSNKRAVRIVNEIADVFKNEVTEIYNLENVSVVDEAIVEDSPYNVNVIKQMLIFALVGIVLSCGIIFVMFYFDNTIKSKNEIEDKLKLAVLGEIPTAKKLTKGKIKLKRKKKISNEDIRAKDIENKAFDNIDNDINLKKDIKDDTVNEELSDNKTKKVATKKKTTTKKTTTKKATTKNKKDEGDE